MRLGDSDVVKSIDEFDYSLNGAVFGPDSNTLALSTEGIKVVDLRSGDMDSLETSGDESIYFEDAAFSPDGRLLAACSQSTDRSSSARIHFWDADSRREVDTLEVGNAANGFVSFSSSDSLVAAAWDEGIGVWSYRLVMSASGQISDLELASVFQHRNDGPAAWIDFDSGGDHIVWTEKVTSSGLARVRVANLKSNQILAFEKPLPQLFNSVRPMPKPHQLAIGVALGADPDNGAAIEIWDFLEDRLVLGGGDLERGSYFGGVAVDRAGRQIGLHRVWRQPKLPL